MSRILLRGGIVVTPDRIAQADILAVDETIARVGVEIADPEAQIVNAEGLHIFPGLIDAHVHLRDPGSTAKEDWLTGTRAALAGGVTTILDMPNNPQPTSTLESMTAKREIARSKAVCDYGLYLGATRQNAGLGLLIQTGAVALKVYLGSSTGDLLVTDLGSLYEHMAEPSVRPVVVHAEDEQALQFFSRDPERKRHSAKRPPLCASLAVSRALALALETGRHLHVAHVSTAREIEWIRAAQSQGAPVTYEVSPHHLFLSTEDEERLGPLGIVNPPLRDPQDVRYLWEHLASCDLIATDHAPHTLEEKYSARSPSGMPGLETMLPLLLTAAHQGRITLEDIARLTSRGPAQVFGLEHKGEIAAGHDADLTLVRLSEEYILQKPWQTKCGWSPFEGSRAQGRVMSVFLRGRQVYSQGRFIAPPGSGREIVLAKER